MSLTSRRKTLTAAAALTASASLIGLVTVLVQDGRNASAVIAPAFFTTTLLLGLRQVQRVERGEEVENERMTRLRGRATPWLAGAAVVVVLLEILALAIVVS